jgi:uncharacterized RDD family membrane protein YckC
LQCPKCGMDVTGGAEKCSGCGEVMADPSAPQTARQFGFVAARPQVVYAGFWLRAVAYAIDVFLLGIVAGWLVLKPMMEHAGVPLDNLRLFLTSTSRQIIAIKLAIWAVGWLYWGLMESSVWQATIGKKALGLQVTDLTGNRISMARASGRYFGKFLSQLIFFLGFVIAGFTRHKQALHDMLAGTLVIKKKT